MRYLLDVNVLVALLDEGHVHHLAALSFVTQAKRKIASCVLTQNGVLRVMNLPGYSAFGAPGFKAIATQLMRLYADVDHEYWPSKLSVVSDDLIDWNRVTGHNQITDVYLLALCVAHGGALATFDQRIALSTVPQAKTENLLVL